VQENELPPDRCPAVVTRETVTTAQISACQERGTAAPGGLPTLGAPRPGGHPPRRSPAGPARTPATQGHSSSDYTTAAPVPLATLVGD
jgi:hypothetical protein